MRRRRMMVVAGAAAAWWALLAGGAGAGVAVAGAGPVTVAGSWGRAIEVPGLGALNAGRSAVVVSVSCALAGSCAAGGRYDAGPADSQAFVVSEKNGRWRQAIEVPGLGALNAGGEAIVNSVSCGSVASCVAGGHYDDGFGFQAFVVSETHGQWEQAIEVPGSGTLNAGGDANLTSVSCALAGNCAAGGYYADLSGRFQALVVSQRHGRWRTAIEVPGLGALNTGGNAFAGSVSCAAGGACAAGGRYTDGSGNRQAFVVSERHGRWGQAIEVPGLGALNKGGDAAVNSVSCTPAGSCAAGGVYRDRSGHDHAFVVSQRHGRWGTAIEVPGLGSLNKGQGAAVKSVSCAPGIDAVEDDESAAGSCAAGGVYTDGSGHHQAFVDSQTHGRWRTPIEVPGSGALNAGGLAVVGSVSCAVAGNCAAGGYYTDASGHLQAFVVIEKHGRWGQAIEVPGLRALNKGGNAITLSVSCALGVDAVQDDDSAAGKCAAGGGYKDGSGASQGFVVTQAHTADPGT